MCWYFIIQNGKKSKKSNQNIPILCQPTLLCQISFQTPRISFTSKTVLSTTCKKKKISILVGFFKKKFQNQFNQHIFHCFCCLKHLKTLAYCCIDKDFSFTYCFFSSVFSVEQAWLSVDIPYSNQKNCCPNLDSHQFSPGVFLTIQVRAKKFERVLFLVGTTQKKPGNPRFGGIVPADCDTGFKKTASSAFLVDSTETPESGPLLRMENKVSMCTRLFLKLLDKKRIINDFLFENRIRIIKKE